MRGYSAEPASTLDLPPADVHDFLIEGRQLEHSPATFYDFGECLLLSLHVKVKGVTRSLRANDMGSLHIAMT